ncbi:MAG: cbb3-type cytochrome c oxidase subunit II [Verrucomicrobiota bacterium]
MNFGPLLFLGLFVSMALSWYGFIFKGQLDLGRQKQVKLDDGSYYPSNRDGLAHQGAEVYRANGCYYCHSQQVGQTGHEFNLTLTKVGTNTEAVVTAILQVKPELGKASARSALKAKRFELLHGVPFADIKQAQKAFDGLAKEGGAELAWEIVPLGPDFAMGWGPRRTVAADYLYDNTVMLGNQRIGPDLANIGLRRPDPKWHLEHLYQPRSKVEKSTMPPYYFLFERRKIENGKTDPEALKVEGDYQIVPKPEAKALVAYLMSLKAATPLFEAPMTVAPKPPPATNAAPAAATNAPVK